MSEISASEEQQHQPDFSHRGVQPFGHECRIRHAVHPLDALRGGDELREQLLVGRRRGQREFERIEQRVLLENLLEGAVEHLAELLVLEFRLFGNVGDRGHEVFGREAFFDRVAPLGRRLPLQFHGDGDALLQRVGHLQRRDHQIPHRTQQEQYECDADRRYDIGVADLPSESFVVFHLRFVPLLFHSCCRDPPLPALLPFPLRACAVRPGCPFAAGRRSLFLCRERLMPRRFRFPAVSCGVSSNTPPSRRLPAG